MCFFKDFFLGGGQRTIKLPSGLAIQKGIPFQSYNLIIVHCWSRVVDNKGNLQRAEK